MIRFLWLVPSIAVVLAGWADWACHVGLIQPRTLGRLQTTAAVTWTGYYLLACVDLAPDYAASILALILAALGVLMATLSHRRTLQLEPTRGRAGLKGDHHERDR